MEDELVTWKNDKEIRKQFGVNHVTDRQDLAA